jgi:hypothetical protein
MRKAFLILGAAISVAAWAQSDSRSEILVLGTYHMANPGHDIHNMQADDVLAPKRQQEIAQLIEVLKKFHPTKIAIESVGNYRVKQYSDYVAGQYPLSSNEIEQIGFRLAKELGHHTIYPVDEDGDFPWEPLVNYAKANGLGEKFDAIEARNAAQVKDDNNFLRSHTVLETLQYMNSDSMAARGIASYYAYVPYGDRFDYAGPNLLAAFYQRNIRIYHNIVKLIESPSDRILVIYGAGHLGWLQQDVSNDPTVRLRKLADVTGQQ